MPLSSLLISRNAKIGKNLPKWVKTTSIRGLSLEWRYRPQKPPSYFHGESVQNHAAKDSGEPGKAPTKFNQPQTVEMYKEFLFKNREWIGQYKMERRISTIGERLGCWQGTDMDLSPKKHRQPQVNWRCSIHVAQGDHATVMNGKVGALPL